MSESLNQGTPSADTGIQVPEVDTKPPVENPQESVSQTPAPILPPQYAGKTVEELVRIAEDRQAMIGRQAAEVTEARQRISSYEQAMAQYQMQQAQQPQTAQQAPDSGPQPFDWEHPDKSVDSRVERKLKTELAETRRQMMMEVAASQAPIAKNMAKSLYPDAFKGVADEELDRAMYGGAAAGNVQPQNLTKPEAWRMLGWILQGEKSGYKMAGPGVTPVSPTATETPMGAKPQNYGGEETPALDDQARSILKGMGMSEEDYLKNRREELRGRK